MPNVVYIVLGVVILVLIVALLYIMFRYCGAQKEITRLRIQRTNDYAQIDQLREKLWHREGKHNGTSN